MILLFSNTKHEQKQVYIMQKKKKSYLSLRRKRKSKLKYE